MNIKNYASSWRKNFENFAKHRGLQNLAFCSFAGRRRHVAHADNYRIINAACKLRNLLTQIDEPLAVFVRRVKRGVERANL